MKVLQILPELNTGGVERGTVDLARELVRGNHQALVISNGGRMVEELESYGARHIRLPVHKKSLFSIIANIPRVAKIIEREEVDIVHVRSRVPAIIGFFACRRTGVDFVTTCHGYYSQSLASRVMGWGKSVIVSSSVIARHMIEDFGVPEERIKLIPRGVDLQRFRFQERKKFGDKKPKTFTIGVIGRLTPIKGHKYFLQALARVIRNFPKVYALMVGDASPGKEKYKEELQILVRRLSLDKYVQFTGRVQNIPQILSRLDVLVLPTVTQEAFGRVVIEAQAAGVPVVATKVGGVVEIIKDGVNGILVEPKNPYDLAQAIIRLFKDLDFSQKLILAGRKNVEENFNLEQMAEKTIKVYEQMQETLRILVIKLSALGDVILSGPSLKALRENFPKANIAVLVDSPYKIILQNCPYINQTLDFALKNKSYKYIWQVSSLLRKMNFDIVVDLQNNCKSHLLAYLSACNRRYGYDNGKFGFLLNRKIKEVKTALSPIAHQARTLKLLGIEQMRENLELWPEDKDEKWAEDFLKNQRRNKSAPLVGINLGASSAWPTKRWPVEKFAQLLNKINDAGMEVVVTGGSQEENIVKHFRLSKKYFINAVNRVSIMQLVCLIKRCNFYITSDSAPLHIAYAVETPVIALFGPTDPRRHTVLSAKQVVIKKKVNCGPCYKRRCRKHSCMEEITVEEVFEAVKQLLNTDIRTSGYQ